MSFTYIRRRNEKGLPTGVPVGCLMDRFPLQPSVVTVHITSLFLCCTLWTRGKQMAFLLPVCNNIIVMLALRQCAARASALITQKVPAKRNPLKQKKPAFCLLPSMLYLRYFTLLSLLPPTSQYICSSLSIIKILLLILLIHVCQPVRYTRDIPVYFPHYTRQ